MQLLDIAKATYDLEVLVVYLLLQVELVELVELVEFHQPQPWLHRQLAEMRGQEQTHPLDQ
jgi:hypothetical protein